MKWMTFLITVFLIPLTVSLARGQDDLRRDSILCEQGIDGTIDFIGETKTHIIAYAANGRPAEVIITRFDESGEWVNFRRRQMAYEGNEATFMLVQGWHSGNQEWVDRMRRSFIYNQAGLLQQRLVEEAPPGGSALQNSQRWSYSYTNNKDEEVILYQAWENGNWENRRRQQFLYNEAGNLESRTWQNWQNGEWRNQLRRLWVYPAPNAVSPSEIITQAWGNMNGEWQNISRRLTDFNLSGLWMNTTFQRWDADSESWVNQNRELHVLNAQNNMEHLLLQTWQEGEWVSLIRESTKRNGLDVTTLVDERDTLAGNWIKARRYGTRFDDDGRILENIRNQYWDTDTETWLNYSETQRYTHFWSEAVVSTRNQLPQVQLCKLPNPYQPGTPVNCEAVSQQAFSVELFDLLGRPVFRERFNGVSSFSIDKGLPAGSYLLYISLGKQARQVQLLTITQF